MLRKHLKQYSDVNTFDYFIHKDLGSFLRNELDFYIKNEVMHLDDVENETALKAAQYLSKIKVIRMIAGKIITFLAQLEDFQKKLWLKKKFVVETQYCVTVGRIPEAFYPEIAANDAQRDEWVRLFAIDQPFFASATTDSDAGGLFVDRMVSQYSVPLRSEFLTSHPTLTLNTSHFSDAFNARLLQAIGTVDEMLDAVLIHGDNFHALSLMQAPYRERVDCIYIDPPYNTGGDEFRYKDTYQHSSWLALFIGRLESALGVLRRDGVFACSLDDNETYRVGALIDRFAPRLVRLGEFVWRTRNTDNRVSSRFSVDHEYIHVFSQQGGRLEGRVVDRSSFKNPDSDPRGPYTTDPLTGKANAQDRPNLHYVIVNPATGDEYPPHPDFGWITDRAGLAALLKDNRIYWPKNPKTGNPRKKRYLSETAERTPVSSLEIEIKQGEGNRDLAALFGDKPMNFPKPVSVMKTVLDVCSPSDALVMDFFAGSGTTAEAVLRLNREEDCSRRVILVEASDYFDSLLLPRIRKATFASVWEDGKPKRPATLEEAKRSPRMMKVVRLESYEDALNNLEMRRTDVQRELLEGAEDRRAGAFREQYLLSYMLDVETRGSQSLLNVAAFTDPTAYQLRVKRPGSDESREVNVDLLETFNWLIGLTVQQIAAPQTFSAAFERDSENRLRLTGGLRQEADGPWWFRTVAGTRPDRRKMLIIWRKRPGGETPEGMEQDNLVLDEWFANQDYSAKDSELDLIYVNGDNNLENLKDPDDTWRVQLIEEDFHRLMFEAEGA